MRVFKESLENSSSTKSNEAKSSSKSRSKRPQASTTTTTESSKNEQAGEDEDDMDEGDDSQSFHVSGTRSNEDFIIAKASAQAKSSGGGVSASTAHLNSSIKLKQITKMISPKWPNRVFAFELIRRIIKLCQGDEWRLQQQQQQQQQEIEQTTEYTTARGGSVSSIEDFDATTSDDLDRLKKRAHFDLKLAKKLKAHAALNQPKNSPAHEENYLILFLQDLMRIACIGATSSCDPLKLVGLDLLNDLILGFARVEEPNAEFKGHLVLEQYQVNYIFIC